MPDKPDFDEINDNVHERVRQMMEPDDKTSTRKIEVLHDDSPVDTPGTAPELGEMPVPKEPLKIKILKDEPAEPSKPEPTPKVVAKKKEPPVPEEPAQPETEEYSDPTTSKAVDDIVATESDQLLAAEDDKLLAAVPPAKKTSWRSRLKDFVGHHKKVIIGSLLLIVLMIAVVPPSRYFTLNAAGVRSGVTVDVTDQSTQQPLKNVRVTVGGATALTDGEGHAKLGKVKLGAKQLTIERRAFSSVTKKITVGWGSNPQGEFKLEPTGTQYAFVVTDFLSGKPVSKVEAISGDSSAFSDENGKILLTMDKPPDTIEVTLQGKTYREEKLQVDADSKSETAAVLVPARKQAFVSKRSGKYDLYKVDIDGKNEQLVLAGTGTERDDIVLISHPTKEVAVLVSTREGKRNKDGYLLSSLTLVNLVDNTTKSIASSERLQVLGWADGRLAYVSVASGASAANPKRHRLISYDSEEEGNKELAASNYFNDVMIAANKIYYAPSSAYQNGVNVSLFRVDANGANRQIIINKEVWTMFRTAYDHITASAQSEWYGYQLGSKDATKQSGEPGNLVSRVYVDSPDSRKSLWIDNRDGKGVLLAYTLDTKQDKVLHTQSGLKNPVRWVTDKTVVYRINTEQETADYALSLDGGQPKKIRDVTNTSGLDRWYYY
ncbi:MAG TPA: hypothetical protein VK694_02395 [Verrucomicrobiae bacterium]|nr:hypothetical protein [Verrucomicrobiae bacterium]